MFGLLCLLPAILSLFPPTVRESGNTYVSPAKRIVTISAGLSEYVAVSETADPIIGCSEYGYDVAMAGLMGEMYPKLKDRRIRMKVFPIDPEQYIQYDLDAIVLDTNQVDVFKQIGYSRLAVTHYNGNDRTGNEIETLQLMGKLTGKNERANRLIKKYSLNEFAAIKELIPETVTPIRISVLVSSGSDGIWMPTGRNYYMLYIPEFLGAVNAARPGLFSRGMFNPEQIIEADPDIIFINSVPGDGFFPATIYNKPEWQALRAVRQKKVYRIPVWSYLGGPAENALLLRWFAEIFYPERTPCLLRQKYREFYQEVYHYTLSDAEIDQSVFVEENRLSAGYERFRQENTGNTLN
ncbi:MAG: ABC transporter substrate-binding protein [Tannerella sp.]|jgi:iron complex transport system substrate-binding protein|nr:ABC transporter substrate-binding protein [Tannerella sp.]